jgi:lysophospholipase L1-like esterase
MAKWLTPSKSGQIYRNASGRVYTGTVGAPVYFEDADAAGAISDGWSYSSTQVIEPEGSLRPVIAGYSTDASGNVTGLVGPNGTIPISMNLPFSNDLKLAQARKALLKVRNGVSGMRVLIVGDSTIVGIGGVGTAVSAGCRPFSPAVKLAKSISQYLTPNVRVDSQLGFGSLITDGYSGYDPRWTYTNWSVSAVDNAIGGGLSSSTASAPASVIAETPWDKVTIFSRNMSTAGAWNVNIDGGANTFVQNNNATPSLVQTVLNAGSVGLHTLNFTKFNGSSSPILGLIYENTTLPQVNVITAGASGQKAAMYGASTNPWDGVGEITAVAADLTILAFGINDWNAGTTLGDAVTAGTFLFQAQQAITAAKLSGSVIVASEVPSKQAGHASLATQQTYVDGLASLASSNGVVFYDGWRRFISQESMPSIYADDLHPKSAGYQDWVDGLFALMAGS